MPYALPIRRCSGISARATVLSLLGLGILAGCEAGQASAEKSAPAVRTACVFEIEKLGQARGVMARQMIVDGKVRGTPAVYWATPGFTNSNKPAERKGEAATLHVALGWRLGALEGGATYSPLDTIIVRASGLDASTVPDGSMWRFTIVENETHEIAFKPSEGAGPIEARFSPEGGGGTVIPDKVADALGGINGGRFEIALVDPQSKVLARRDVRPIRGYEFKELAQRAETGVKPLAERPESCTAPASL